MAGTKTELTVDVNAEHIGLINTSKEKYNIADEGKVVRHHHGLPDYQPRHPRHRFQRRPLPPLRVG